MKSLFKNYSVAVMALFTCMSFSNAYADNVTIKVSVAEELQETVKDIGLVNNPWSSAGAFPKSVRFPVVDGVATIAVEIDKPQLAWIQYGSLGLPLVLESGEYSANLKKVEHVMFLYFEGGEGNKALYGFRNTPKFDKALKANLVAHREAAERFEKHGEASQEENAKQTKATGEVLAIMQLESFSRVIKGDYDPAYKVMALEIYRDIWPRTFRLMDELAAAEPNYEPAQKLIAKYKADYEKQQSYGAGTLYADVSGTDANGKQLKLSDSIAKNKLVLLEFWASWCSPCRAEFPHLTKAYNKYQKKGFEIFAVSVDTDHDDWTQALEEEGVNWINVVDLDGVDSQAAKTYNVQGVPASWLIDASGNIVAKGLRGKELDAKLKEIYGE